MNANYLKLNNNATEFILIALKNNLSKITIPQIKIGDSTFAPVSQVRDLDVIMDSTMTLVPHICCKIGFSSTQKSWQDSKILKGTLPDLM